MLSSTEVVSKRFFFNLEYRCRKCGLEFKRQDRGETEVDRDLFLCAEAELVTGKDFDSVVKGSVHACRPCDDIDCHGVSEVILVEVAEIDDDV